MLATFTTSLDSRPLRRVVAVKNLTRAQPRKSIRYSCSVIGSLAGVIEMMMNGSEKFTVKPYMYTIGPTREAKPDHDWL